MKGGSGDGDVALSDLDRNCDSGRGCGTICSDHWRFCDSLLVMMNVV